MLNLLKDIITWAFVLLFSVFTLTGVLLGFIAGLSYKNIKRDSAGKPEKTAAKPGKVMDIHFHKN